jgi:hypothetical protein
MVAIRSALSLDASIYVRFAPNIGHPSLAKQLPEANASYAMV